ncbi:Fic family protein [Stenotrophomonas sp. SAU14A_NAIMI4_5]|uniref:Fic family protein n=1 Tax=Stenotrophomonas sp. SAU14A_NAIMI4_5 TaxID=2072413 RepID=UPI001C1F215E|nr:Fic family protein [Stenotrophomonas sp. SAU14A_NAIMI4_5]
MSDQDTLLRVLDQAQRAGGAHWEGLSSRELSLQAGIPWTTTKRLLVLLQNAGTVMREGKARSTRYKRVATSPVNTGSGDTGGYPRFDDGRALLAELKRPLVQRTPVAYQRPFVDDYVPNQSQLLPDRLLNELHAAARMSGQQPAGTYARNVMEPLLLDLSWSSSRLEGNRYSLLETKELFESGTRSGDLDAVMLLNHKSAIEFLVNEVPMVGLTEPVVRNLHATLMRDLLADSSGLGNIRSRMIQIRDTSYIPEQAPGVLQEMFSRIIVKAKQINNPVEAAFFLWVNVAYLQPFEDGNKRTSRLAANIPLLMYNFAPLSFLDIDSHDYAYAMMGIYERCDVALAVDLFEIAYSRSIQKYQIQLAAAVAPDPTRIRLRGAMNDMIGLVVRDRQTIRQAINALQIEASDAAPLGALVEEELKHLGEHNCSRFYITMRQVNEWVAAGRPR